MYSRADLDVVFVSGFVMVLMPLKKQSVFWKLFNFLNMLKSLSLLSGRKIEIIKCL